MGLFGTIVTFFYSWYIVPREIAREVSSKPGYSIDAGEWLAEDAHGSPCLLWVLCDWPSKTGRRSSD